MHAAMIRHNRNHIPTIMIAMMMAKPRNYKNRITCYFRLPETNSSHQKIDPWKRSECNVLETIIFRGELLVLGRVKTLRLAARGKNPISKKLLENLRWKVNKQLQQAMQVWQNPLVFSRLVAFPVGFLPLGHPRPKQYRICQGCD